MKRTELVRRQRIAYTRRILKAYRAASAAEHAHGAEWYAEESDRLAELALELGLPVRSVCGAAAAISPGMRWDLVPGYVDALHRNGASLAIVALSNVVSNVPAVMLLLPFAEHPLGGAVLALFSTMAGNLLIVGSIANIIVVDQAARYGITISWREHARVGVPVTLLSLGVAVDLSAGF